MSIRANAWNAVMTAEPGEHTSERLERGDDRRAG
jgi:hypothetical protein